MSRRARARSSSSTDRALSCHASMWGNSSHSPSDTPPGYSGYLRVLMYLSDVKISSSLPNPELLPSKKSQKPVILLGPGTHAQ